MPAPDPELLGDLEPDGEDRVQRGQRVLEDHGDALAADPAALLVGHREHVLAVEPDLPAGDEAGRHVQDAHDGLRGDALAGAGLAQHGQCLARVDVVRHAVDDLGDAVPGAELHPQVLDLEQPAGGASGRRSPARTRRRECRTTDRLLPEFRVEGLADRLAEHDEAQHGGDEERGGEEQQVRATTRM